MEKIISGHICVSPSEIEFDYTMAPGTESLVGKTQAEVLDIFDIIEGENRKVRVQKIAEGERKAIHKNGDLHLTGHVWVFNDKGEVLLQERSAEKKSSAGLLSTSASGHISTGDTMVSGSVREVEEEIGLTVQESDLIPLGCISKPGPENNEIMGLFALKYNGSTDDLVLQAEEVASVKRVSLSELETDWKDPVRTKLYAKKTPEYQKMVIEGIRKILEQK